MDLTLRFPRVPRVGVPGGLACLVCLACLACLAGEAQAGVGVAAVLIGGRPTPPPPPEPPAAPPRTLTLERDQVRGTFVTVDATGAAQYVEFFRSTLYVLREGTVDEAAAARLLDAAEGLDWSRVEDPDVLPDDPSLERESDSFTLTLRGGAHASPRSASAEIHRTTAEFMEFVDALRTDPAFAALPGAAPGRRIRAVPIPADQAARSLARGIAFPDPFEAQVWPAVARAALQAPGRFLALPDDAESALRTASGRPGPPWLVGHGGRHYRLELYETE